MADMERVAGTECLWDLVLRSRQDPSIDVVLIPGVQTVLPEDWGICQPSWTSIQQESGARIRFLEFRPQFQPDENFSWQTLLEQASHLLQDLSALRTDPDVQFRPILFVCHSLGGMILKQALCIANFKYDTYVQLLSSIAGIVFLGTPHALPSPTQLEELESHCLDLLRAVRNENLTKQQVAVLKDGSAPLTNLAIRFRDVNIRVDMLSVYEGKKTRIKSNPHKFFGRLRDVVLVDRGLASTGSPLEELLELPLSHPELCQLADKYGRPHPRIQSWMKSVLSTSVKSVQDRLVPHRPQLLTTSVEQDKTATLLPHKKTSYSKADAHATTEPSIDAGDTGDAQYGSTNLDVEIVSLLEGFEPERRKATLPCYSFGTYLRNKHFSGRQDVLEKLDTTLLPSDRKLTSAEPQPPKHLTIFGTGGLGKTEVALEFAFSRHTYFDAVFILRADDIEKFELDFAGIAARLGLEDEKEARSEVVSRELAKGWLLNPKKILDQEHDTVGQTEATWLIVLDNADDPDQFMEYHDVFSAGNWLITSRHPLSKTAFSSTTVPVDLAPLDVYAGVKLFQSLTLSEFAAKEIEEVIATLAGLPLAIAQIAGVIRRRHLSLSQFLDWYHDEAELPELLKLELQPRQPTARGTIATIWAIEDLTVSSRSLITSMAFLDPDRIQDYLLIDEGAKAISDPTFPKRKGSFYEARGDLLDRSLIQQMDESSVRLHRVLQDVVRTKMRVPSEQAFRDTVQMVLSAWPPAELNKAHSVTRWPRCQQLYPHVTFLQKKYKAEYVQDNEARFQYATLLYNAGWWQHERGNSHTILRILRAAESTCESCERTIEAKNLLNDIHYGLGAIANETNDAKSCLSHNQKFLAMRQEIAQEQGNDLRLGIAYNQVGTGWMMANDFDKAHQSFSDSMRTYRSLSGTDFPHGHYIVAKANLGLCLWMQGDLDSAAGVFEEAIRERAAVFGEMDMESFRPGRLYYGLGNVRFSQGQLVKAEECHKTALKLFHGSIGPHHHRTADISHRVAQHFLRHGDTDNADQWIYTTPPITWKALALRPPLAVTSSSPARIAPVSCGPKINQDSKLVVQALHIWNADRTIYRPEIARTTHLRARIQLFQGHVAEANKLLADARRIRQEVLRERKQETMTTTLAPDKADIKGQETEKSRDMEGEKSGQDDRALERLMEEQQAEFDELVTFWSR